MQPLKDLYKKKDWQDPNSLNSSQKESKEILDTARKDKKLSNRSTEFLHITWTIIDKKPPEWCHYNYAQPVYLAALDIQNCWSAQEFWFYKL